MKYFFKAGVVITVLAGILLFFQPLGTPNFIACATGFGCASIVSLLSGILIVKEKM